MEISEYLKAERNQPWREELRKSVKNADRTKRERVVMPEQDPVIRATDRKSTRLNSSH